MLTFDNASAWELPDRGLVRTGYAADLVVFDEDAHPAAPADRRDRTCRAAPAAWCRRPTASPRPIVNGAVAFENGEATGNYAGQGAEGAVGRLATFRRPIGVPPLTLPSLARRVPPSPRLRGEGSGNGPARAARR